MGTSPLFSSRPSVPWHISLIILFFFFWSSKRHLYLFLSFYRNCHWSKINYFSQGFSQSSSQTHLSRSSGQPWIQTSFGYLFPQLLLHPYEIQFPHIHLGRKAGNSFLFFYEASNAFQRSVVGWTCPGALPTLRFCSVSTPAWQYFLFWEIIIIINCLTYHWDFGEKGNRANTHLLFCEELW